MKTKVFISSVIFSAMWLAGASPIPEVRTKEEFNAAIIRFIVDKSDHAIGVKDPDFPARNEAIINDGRDWESSLASIIRNPEKYTSSGSEVAFGASELRDTTTDPRIIEASLTLLGKMLELAEAAPEEHVGYYVSGVRSFVSSLSRVKHADVLTALLDYANSDRERRNQFFTHFSYAHLAKAVDHHGGLRHVPAARELAKRLRGENLDDVAMTLDRAIIGIERRGDSSRAGGKETRETGNDIGKKSKEKFQDFSDGWAFAALAIALGAAVYLGLTYLRKK